MIMSAVYLTNDLMFGSRVTGDAQKLGVTVEVAYSIEAALQKLDSEKTKLVFIDLGVSRDGLAELVARIRAGAPQAAIIAYGPHVHEELLQTATAAGCDQVLTQGQFNSTAGHLLETYCARG